MSQIQPDKLKLLIEKICLTSPSHTSSGCGTGCDLDTQESVRLAILSWAESLVPEEHHHTNCIWPDCNADFNDCRSSILSKIEERRKV